MFVVAALVVVAAGLGVAGFRIERDGSGWPRFIVRSNETALEADRAAQRNMIAPASDAQDPAYKPIAAQETASTSAPTSQTASADTPTAPVASASAPPSEIGRAHV